MKRLAAHHAMEVRGWLMGSAQIWVAVFTCTLQKRRSIGNMKACALSTSYAVPLSPPVMYWAICPWIDQNGLVADTEPSEFLL